MHLFALNIAGNTLYELLRGDKLVKRLESNNI